MAIEKLKNNLQDSNIKPEQPQFKNYKRPLTQTDQTTDTTQKSRAHIFKFLHTTYTICEENCECSRVQTSL